MYTCNICGANFDKATSLGGHKSSHARGLEGYNTLTPFKCTQCGKESKLSASDREKKKKFCSYDCYNAHRSARKLASNAVVEGVTLDITVSELRKAKATASNCMICGRSFAENNLKKCTDHDHANDKYRGILCQPCNRMLGWYENNAKSINNYLMDV